MIDNKSQQIETVEISQDGDDYFLTRIDANGQKYEMPLTEANVVFLSQLFPKYAHKIAVHKTANLPGVSLSFSLPVEKVRLNVNLNSSDVVIDMMDAYGGVSGYSLSAALARELGQRLIAKAGEAEQELNSRTKQ